MGLAQMQRALARLYTKGGLRDQFLADPPGVGATLGLTPAETAQIAEAARQVEFFAHSLHHKRLGEVSKLLPLTRRALGSAFAAHFLRFADTYVPSGIKKHQADALAFVAHLEQLPLDQVWMTDLARYEATWLNLADPTRRVVVRRLAYHPGQVRQALEADATDVALAPCFTLALWVRLAPGGRIWHIII